MDSKVYDNFSAFKPRVASYLLFSDWSRSPRGEKKKADKSSNIYSVVKKQSPKHNSRPQMSFEPPPPIVTDSSVPPTIPTRPAQHLISNEETTALDSSLVSFSSKDCFYC